MDECEHEYESVDVAYMGSPETRVGWFCIYCDEEKEFDCE